MDNDREEITFIDKDRKRESFVEHCSDMNWIVNSSFLYDLRAGHWRDALYRIKATYMLFPDDEERLTYFERNFEGYLHLLGEITDVFGEWKEYLEEKKSEEEIA